MNILGRPHILCVDDEPHVLEALTDALRRSFAVTTASNGAEALERLETDGPFVAVISDMRMPGMNGAGLLAAVQYKDPNAVRILLTGQADVDVAAAAVNHGQIFRFLTKPCSLETLLQALAAALRHHRLLTAEQTLLEETLNGSLKALTDVLALAKPEAFGRANRLRAAAGTLARHAGISNIWEIEIAAMLCQVGCFTLPDATAARYYDGEPLADAEEVLVDRLPIVAARLIQNIPRIEGVHAILANQNAPLLPATENESQPPAGARVLKIVHDFDLLESAGQEPDIALAYMRGSHRYDPDLLEQFAELNGATDKTLEVKEVALGNVEIGQSFAEDVRPLGGGILVARAQEVTEALLQRLENLPPHIRTHTVRVFTRNPAERVSQTPHRLTPAAQ